MSGRPEAMAERENHEASRAGFMTTILGHIDERDQPDLFGSLQSRGFQAQGVGNISQFAVL